MAEKKIDPHFYSHYKRNLAEATDYMTGQIDVVCPAGRRIYGVTQGEGGVFCTIEQNFLAVKKEPSTVTLSCCDDYKGCATWKAAKDKDRESKRVFTQDPEKMFGD